VPYIELDLTIGTAQRGGMWKLQGIVRLDRNAPSTRLHPGELGSVELSNGKPVPKGYGCCIRPAGAGTYDDHIEQGGMRLWINCSVCGIG
jgi:hypothetical protein